MLTILLARRVSQRYILDQSNNKDIFGPMIFQVPRSDTRHSRPNPARSDLVKPAGPLNESWNSFGQGRDRLVSAPTDELADIDRALGNAARMHWMQGLPRQSAGGLPEDSDHGPQVDRAACSGRGPSSVAWIRIVRSSENRAPRAFGGGLRRQGLERGRSRPVRRFMSTIPCQPPGQKKHPARPGRNEKAGLRLRRRLGGGSIRSEV